MPKYGKPKILLIDLAQKITDRLAELGFNARAGTFGTPYETKEDDGFDVMGPSFDLPNFAEQEILFIDLAMPKFGSRPDNSPRAVPGETYVYVKHNLGWIDPRPRAMAIFQEDCDRILTHGNLVVVFAAPRIKQQIVMGEQGYGGIRPTKELDFDNWSFSSLFHEDRMWINDDTGQEIHIEKDNALARLIKAHGHDAKYLATIESRRDWDQELIPIARSKFGAPVACVATREGQKGAVIILPQFKDKEAVIVELMQNVLPNYFPRLFPDHEGAKWVHRDAYEHPSVTERRRRQQATREQAKKEIESLETEIGTEARTWSFLHELLTESGEKLVAAVKEALEHIGFRQVKNVDEENPEGVNKQEDLQVHDRVPVLLAEVKGISGLPTEKDTLQIIKYVHRRAKEWRHFDVHGISIINAQRNLPPLERDHDRVFTQAQVDDAANHGTALITTWDLFRLFRAMMKWGWPKECVQDVFYDKGRITPIPSHYRPVGTVGHFYTKPKVISIDVAESCTIRVGDKLGFAFPDEFYEEIVESLEIDKKTVSQAGPNDKVGHRTKLNRNDVALGTVVYQVAHAPAPDKCQKKN